MASSRRIKEPGRSLYFAYGSNIRSAQMAERVPGAKWAGTAILPDHRLAFVGYSRNWDGGVANVVAHKGWRVPGALYRMTGRDFARMDSYEGALYKRKSVTVTMPAEDLVVAVAYVRTKSAEPYSEPSDEYVAALLEGYRECGFGRDYVKTLRRAADPSTLPPGRGEKFPGR
jgi:gamma-glutamylcyclotransferase (GGCT)/AIG2-like uncharacterized protein YtfP